MPFIYILYPEKLNKYYVGSCVNLERRSHEHNIGQPKFTGTGIPWKIVYSEEYSTHAEARIREPQIKK